MKVYKVRFIWMEGLRESVVYFESRGPKGITKELWNHYGSHTILDLREIC